MLGGVPRRSHNDRLLLAEVRLTTSDVTVPGRNVSGEGTVSERG